MKLSLVAVLFLTSFAFSEELNSPKGLSGHYKLAYIASDLSGLYRNDESKQPSAESFNYKEIAEPQIPAPIFLLHNPQGPSATVIGGGSDSPRLCEGEAELLSQNLECAPLAKETWKDEKTKCEITKAFVENILFSITDGLRYSRTELVFFSEETAEQCVKYKENIAEELEKGSAADYFKAMKAAGVINDPKDLPDLFALTHFYQTSPTDKDSVAYPDGNHSGAYELNYSERSQSKSWFGKEQKDLEESSVFNASKKLRVENLDNVLLFHKPQEHQLQLSGGGQNKMRDCKQVSEEGASDETFECTLFKAKEEELGTGCTIEHWIFERVTLRKEETPRYERVEQRRFVSSNLEGCEKYRQKIASEIKEGSAELFFRVLFETGGISSLDKMGDTFQLSHEYTTTPF